MASTTKQFHRLLKTIGSFSNGQATVDMDNVDFDELASFDVIVAPTDGPYRGGKFTFSVILDEGFPECAPRIECKTPIYHPNIDTEDGSLCFSLLDEDWDQDLTLEDVVQGLLFLFYHPNVSDPLSQFFDGTESDEEFQLNLRKVLRGGRHFGFDFPPNLDPEFMDDGVSEEDLGTELCVPDESKSPQCNVNSDDTDMECDSDLSRQSSVCGGVEKSLELDLSVKVDQGDEKGPEARGKSPPLVTTLKSVGRRLLRTAVQLLGTYA